MLLPFSFSPTYLGMKRDHRVLTDTAEINISKCISVSCSLMVDAVRGLPTSCYPFSRAFHCGVFAISFGAQERESLGLGFSHSKACALLERGAVRNHRVATSWKTRALFRSEAPGKEHIVKQWAVFNCADLARVVLRFPLDFTDLYLRFACSVVIPVHAFFFPA